MTALLLEVLKQLRVASACQLGNVSSCLDLLHFVDTLVPLDDGLGCDDPVGIELAQDVNGFRNLEDIYNFGFFALLSRDSSIELRIFRGFFFRPGQFLVLSFWKLFKLFEVFFQLILLQVF